MKKSERQSRLLELIEEVDIGTQEMLTELLNREGFQVTQATVSRDINELQLGKISGKNGRQKYVVLDRDDVHIGSKYIRVLRDGFVSMDSAQNILVVKTVPGMAMAVAAALDTMRLKEVVGSIAGDDTIMMAIKTEADVRSVMDKIRGIL